VNARGVNAGVNTAVNVAVNDGVTIVGGVRMELRVWAYTGTECVLLASNRFVVNLICTVLSRAAERS